MRSQDTMYVAQDLYSLYCWHCCSCLADGSMRPKRLAVRSAGRHNRRIHDGALHIWGHGCSDRHGEEVEWEVPPQPEAAT